MCNMYTNSSFTHSDTRISGVKVQSLHRVCTKLQAKYTEICEMYKNAYELNVYRLMSSYCTRVIGKSVYKEHVCTNVQKLST